MKTIEQILAQIEKVKVDDWMGIIQADLIFSLPFDAAKPFLKAGAMAGAWTPNDTDEKVRAAMLDYLPFAWEKANNHRGISASRSVDHFKAWLWLLGQDALATRLAAVYEYYGKPCLVLVSDFLDFDWRAQDDGNWTNHEGETGTTAERALAAHGITSARPNCAGLTTDAAA